MAFNFNNNLLVILIGFVLVLFHSNNIKFTYATSRLVLLDENNNKPEKFSSLPQQPIFPIAPLQQNTPSFMLPTLPSLPQQPIGNNNINNGFMNTPTFSLPTLPPLPKLPPLPSLPIMPFPTLPSNNAIPSFPSSVAPPRPSPLGLHHHGGEDDTN
ncbi:hypothetical protein HN51_036254 [Arachis hypogaea]|nr:uncharacterized protein DS421_13g416280 [Arachis hypogaea]